jgi:hypothetical protein
MNRHIANNFLPIYIGWEKKNQMQLYLKLCYNIFICLYDSKSRKPDGVGGPLKPYISKTLSSEGNTEPSRPLKLSIGEEAHGAGVEGFELEASWLRPSAVGFCGEFPVGLLFDPLPDVKEMVTDCCCCICCWFFIGDFGLRASISGVVTTR